MAEIINLRVARKARNRAADKAKAAENRAKHGLTKDALNGTKAEQKRTERTLDGAKRDTDRND